ncbi:FCRLB protein, partial [Certhia brachydactyla]|nr:FCRLB protein [Certhia brachydactyla]
SCPTATPVLQVPAGTLLEGDKVTLRCRVRQKESVSVAHFYHDGKLLWRHFGSTELSLSPLQLQHSGRYSCSVRGNPWSSRWMESA